jgi:hypothetical protein
MTYDDFDTQIQPEEFHEPDEFLDDQFETCNRPDAPEYHEVSDFQWDYMNGEYPDEGLPFDEGSDRDNWEAEQVFQDGPDY